jgi:hypothetical protein
MLSINGAGWDISLGLAGLIIGLLLFAAAVTENSKDLALSAGPFVSPYISINSWTAPLILFKKNWFIMAVISFVIWTTLLPG